jgi:hypothetical protein
MEVNPATGGSGGGREHSEIQAALGLMQTSGKPSDSRGVMIAWDARRADWWCRTT